MYISRHPVMHFVVAVLMAVAAALITATGPLLVLSTSFGLSPAVTLQLEVQKAELAELAGLAELPQQVASAAQVQ